MTLVVVSRRGDAGGRELDHLLVMAGVELVPVDLDQLTTARDGWRRYGMGRHAAALNFGDCFPYALASTSGEPLLFKRTDFSHTDVAVAVPLEQR